METEEKKSRKRTSVEDIEEQIRKLSEKKKAKQQSRWAELGKFAESVAKNGQEAFNQAAFFEELDKIMKGKNE